MTTNTTPQDPAVLLRDLLKREPGVFTRAEEDALRTVLADRDQLRPEYGIRADFIDTTSGEFTVADNLDDALEALAAFDARHGDKVLSRELVERPVGEWRKVGGERG